MASETSDSRLLRYSLVAVWLGTAAVSIVEWRGQSQDLLQASALVPAGWTDCLIAAGVVADLLLGLALWLRPNRVTYAAALFVMSVMTVLASLVQPSLWLHPLGPLLKNLPIAAALWVLARGAR